MFSPSFVKSVLALVVLSGVVAASNPLDARRSRHPKRQSIPEDNIVDCDFVLQPTAEVDTSSTDDLSFEFQTIIGGALQGATDSIVNSISLNFTANLDENNTFGVHNQLGSQTSSSQESKEIIEGWADTSLPGFASNWIVHNVTCQ